ncbi:MAG: penicillin acylase family protein [Phycisphaerales bacterium]|nr:MAG: penicillin acylase family protein [Phycisphaerales bacterium]
MTLCRLRAVGVSIAVFTMICSARPADLPGAGQDAGKTVVYRDTWGVPHIYAPTTEAGTYAMGWAQAEDRPQELLKNFLRAMGQSARFDGPKGIQSDTVAHLWDHYGTAKRYFHKNGPETRGQICAFVRGINDFYAAHPEDIPTWWGERKVDEYMVVAFGRLFLYSWSIGQALGDLRAGGIQPGFDEESRGSNQWAVSPQRSAEGAAILCIDPHLSWWGPSRFWEFRIHAGELHGSGVTLAGFPGIGLGHNENVAWAMTTGGPDTADVYELKLKPDDPTKYQYDGEWRPLSRRAVTLEVKGIGPKVITVWSSHHGPIVAMRGGKAYAAKIAYADEVQVAEAWREFNIAEDYRGVMKGLSTQQLFPQNVMVADTSGNIYYQRTGRVPHRPSGYNWSKPVDGSTSATEWNGLHPASDHLQVLNPPQGYMQNCNIPPDVMMVDSPFSPEKSLSYIYGSSGGHTNQRGARAVQLLHADSSVTVEEAMAYACDVHPYGVERWLTALKRADAEFGKFLRSDADYEAGIKDLLSWNGDLRRDSAAALKYYYWRRQIVEDYGDEEVSYAASRVDFHLAALGKQAPEIELSDMELQAAVDSLAVAMAKLKSDHGSLDAAFGDTFRVGRDDVSWPLGGGGDYGLTTLRNVGYGSERDDHTRWADRGQTSTQIVLLSKPIQSWTYLPVGQSDRPASAHYRDQAEKLFSPRRLKPTWWLPEDLARHVESRSVLPKATQTDAQATQLADSAPEAPGFQSREEVLEALRTGKIKAINPVIEMPKGVELIKDIEYGRVGDRVLKLDLYKPKKTAGAGPGLVFIHGGAWKGGNKDIYRIYAARYAQRGYVAVSIAYRLSGEAPFPAAVEDAKCAVRWMRTNADKYGVDAQNICVVGGSAGGHLALMVGYTSGDESLEGSGGHKGVSSRVQAVVDIYGPCDLTVPVVRDAGVVREFLGGQKYEDARELYRKASPLFALTADDPPTLLLHGTLDEVVPIDQSDKLASALKQVGVKFTYDRLDGWPHVMDIAQIVFDRCVFFIDRFLGEHMPVPKPAES